MYNKEDILAKVNAANGTNFTAEEILIGDPMPSTGKHNTTVLLDGVEAKGWTGYKTVEYDRLRLQDVIPPNTFYCYGTGTGPASVILEQLKAHGVDLTDRDTVYDTVNYSSGVYTLQLIATDYKWTGSTTILLQAAPTTMSGTVNAGSMATPTVA